MCVYVVYVEVNTSLIAFSRKGNWLDDVIFLLKAP